jgi:hypothetical protein
VSTEDANRLYREFEGQTGDKTFYSGPFSWLNNLVASAEDVYDGIAGDESDDTWWGCADASPQLRQYMQANDKTSGNQYDNLTSRNWLGLQHNQVVSTAPDGGRRVYDPWAGAEMDYPEHIDDTILPVGQLLELVTQGEVDPTGYGQNKQIAGNTRFDVTGGAMKAWDWARGLFD